MKVPAVTRQHVSLGNRLFHDLSVPIAIPTNCPGQYSTPVDLFDGQAIPHGSYPASGHLPARLEPRSWASPGSRLTETYRKPPDHVTLRQARVPQHGPRIGPSLLFGCIQGLADGNAGECERRSPRSDAEPAARSVVAVGGDLVAVDCDADGLAAVGYPDMVLAVDIRCRLR
jgi:hypothetical protein